MDNTKKREWIVHFVNNTISCLMSRRAAEQYLRNRGDADYIVKVYGDHRGQKVYNNRDAAIVFCEVFTKKSKNLQFAIV